MSYLESYNINNSFSAIYIIDIEGNTVSSTDETFIGNNYSFREYFKSAINNQSIVTSAIGVTSNKLGYYFSSPIYSDENLIGVLVGKLEPESIHQHISYNSGHANHKLFFTDVNGINYLMNKI